MNPIPLALPHGDAARLLGIHPVTLRRMRAAGHLPITPLSIHTRPWYSTRALEEWLRCRSAGDPYTPMPAEYFRLLTVAEAAAELGISRASAYRNIQRYMDPVPLGGEVRIPRCRLCDYLDSERNAG